MSKKPALLPPSFQKATAIFATLLIVVGIVTVAYVSSEKPAPVGPTPPSESSAPPNAGLTGPRMVLQSDHAITVMTFDGRSERYETIDAFLSQYGSTSIRSHGTEAATGAIVFFSTSTTPVPGQVSPHRRQFAVMGEAQSDGAGIIQVTGEDGQIKRIITRLANGTPLRVTAIVGWFDDETIAVEATLDENRVLAAVPLIGASTKIRDLGGDVLFAYAHSGYAWLMTGAIGEGLESPPTGPSELIRVSKNGEEIRVTRDELRVISSVATDGAEHLAYTTDDGQSFVMTLGDGSSRATLGSRRPLQFLPDGNLLIRDGFDLAVFDLKTNATTKIGSLPEGSIRVFLFEDAP
ncbi:hypothetical protein KBC59_04555 [Patescibacteria group bacterium]|nr:hypothetical protein [Patescibacteria group bacterium]